jgi:hypothetical protein
MTKRKRANNDLQNITKKTEDRATLKTGDEFMCPGRISSSCSTCGIIRFTFVTNPVISHE